MATPKENQSDRPVVGADGLPPKPGSSASTPDAGPTNKSEAPLIVTPPSGTDQKHNVSKETEMAKTEAEKETDEQKVAKAKPAKEMKDMQQAPSAGEMTAENEPQDDPYPPEPSVRDASGTPVRASVKAKEDAEAQFTPQSPAEGAWKDRKGKKGDDDNDDDDDPTKVDPAKSAQATTAAGKKPVQK